MIVRRRSSSWLALLLVAGIAAGCGHAPSAPVVSSEGVQTTGASPAVVKSAPQASSLVGDLAGGLLRLVFRVLNLVGSLGGSLTNGRWRVDIPAGAVEGSATVTLGVLTSTSPECHLEIQPSSKNQFAVPVRLSASCAGVSSGELSTYVIFWYDPATRRWVEQQSRVDLVAKTVSAELRHFSIYAVGPRGSKASW